LSCSLTWARCFDMLEQCVFMLEQCVSCWKVAFNVGKVDCMWR
jgi:hypothetical protein